MKENPSIQEVLADTTGDEKAPALQGTPTSYTPEHAPTITSALSAVGESIATDSVTGATLQTLESTLTDTPIDFGGLSMTLEEIEQIPNLERNKAIWAEMEEGNFAHEEELTFITPHVCLLYQKYGREVMNLKKLTTAEGLSIPHSVTHLYLDGLTTAEGLTIPESVTHLLLNNLTTAEGLTIPDSVTRLYLNNLTTAEGLTIPNSVEYLSLNSLTTAEGLSIPNSVTLLSLDGLTTPEGLTVPNAVTHLYLNNLTTAEGLVIPHSVTWLCLNNLTTAEGLTIPDSVTNLYLKGLPQPEKDKLITRYPRFAGKI
jgi:hypothetical protein